MLIRTLLLAIFLISSALSVCVAEPVPMPASSSDTIETATISASSSDVTDTATQPASSSDVAKSATMPASPSKIASEQAMTMEEEALEHVTVSAEDWLDGNTYYIRYTFTNPTDVAIDKKVDLTVVSYERCTPDKPFNSHYQCNAELSHLVIPPRSTYETTIALPQHIISEFNRFTSAKFYFADSSILRYGQSFFNHPDSIFSITPFISEDQKSLSLSIYNKSFLTPITKLSDISIALNNLCDPDYTRTAIAGPILLTINPRKTHTQFLINLPPTLLKHTTKEIKKNSNTYALFNLPAGLLMHINLKINDVPHVYSASLSMEPPFTVLKNYFYTNCFETTYTEPQNLSPSKYGSYYLDNTYLHLYFPLKNHSNEPLSAPAYKYEILISYFNQDTLPKEFIARISLPNDFSIAPNETKYFSCKIPLPYDFYKLNPFYHLLTLYSCQTPPSSDLSKIELAPSNNPLSESQYTPIKLSMVLY